jgi:hypothetical protein
VGSWYALLGWTITSFLSFPFLTVLAFELGFVLARSVLYCLSHDSPFALVCLFIYLFSSGYFEDRVPLFAQGGLYHNPPILSFLMLLGWQVHTSILNFFPLRLTLHLLSLAWNLDPPHLGNPHEQLAMVNPSLCSSPVPALNPILLISASQEARSTSVSLRCLAQISIFIGQNGQILILSNLSYEIRFWNSKKIYFFSQSIACFPSLSSLYGV